ncbi:hypothetical protein [Chitinimonas sp. BJB300]|nr:hypothetical protein [Chitinimonas sp. BJB300]PHV12243.1 hypothetical protein CSQ89_06860 [Chitinimonas sp. BJB300]TSJ85217.1 hypothetical protein FG002_018125 [Chitinimonas sp. BJB300]
MIVPFGLAQSGWIGAATGGSAFFGISFVGPLLFLALGIYRIYLVARVPGILDSQTSTGFIAFMRVIGTLCLYFGAVVTVLGWVAGPLMRVFNTVKSESGVEYFVVGLYLTLAAGIGVVGLFLYEYSRLLAFERNALQTRD